jgi:hypothetical protein
MSVAAKNVFTKGTTQRGARAGTRTARASGRDSFFRSAFIALREDQIETGDSLSDIK